MLDYAFCKTDGQAESMDCTVLALSVAASMPYPEAYAALAAVGRKPGQPFTITKAWPSGMFRQYRVKRVAGDVFSLGRFTRTMGKSGRFIARMKYSGKFVGHVVAIVDGVVHDRNVETRGAYQRLSEIWQLTEE